MGLSPKTMMQSARQMYPISFLHSLGPKNCLQSEYGFSVKRSRPVGLGSFGWMFGSDLPASREKESSGLYAEECGKCAQAHSQPIAQPSTMARTTG